MFIALFFSTVFTLVYGYIAVNSRRAEQVMIPLLDILQSVPVLGFLSITVTGTGSLAGDGWLNALLGKCFPDLRLNCFKPLLHVSSEVLSSLQRPVP
jgi:ABC-type proline/glycine betaine transport system permease subunit